MLEEFILDLIETERRFPTGSHFRDARENVCSANVCLLFHVSCLTCWYSSYVLSICLLIESKTFCFNMVETFQRS